MSSTVLPTPENSLLDNTVYLVRFRTHHTLDDIGTMLDHVGNADTTVLHCWDIVINKKTQAFFYLFEIKSECRPTHRSVCQSGIGLSAITGIPRLDCPWTALNPIRLLCLSGYRDGQFVLLAPGSRFMSAGCQFCLCYVLGRYQTIIGMGVSTSTL